MRNLKHIRSFVFGKARYHLQGKSGEEIILTINYKDNAYKITKIKGKVDSEFSSEVSSIATELLAKKHGVNFANT